MKKNNIRLLTNEELRIFLDKYSFEEKDGFVWVTVKDFNRPTIHSVNKSFSVTCNNRKITIYAETISLWINNFKDRHLIEVQQAVNKLFLMYQNIDAKDVAKILNEEI